MPLAGTKTRKSPLPLYFDNLAALDTWRATVAGPIDHSEGVLKFIARKLRPADSVGKGKLLVSHDFKGGYVEDPFSKSYTFNWWSSTEHFNYFSHRRITIPPPEWITAAHRAGTTMLGTIIFEGGSELDMLRMLMGKVPGINTASEVETQANSTLPLTPYYAELLADIAAERGFDGYLLNIEIGLGRGAEQARVLAAWITILQAEMIKKVGPHAQTIWYDSVTIRGELWWQDRLNSANLPFFLNSTGIFTNYWWYNDAPGKEVVYFNNLDPNLTGQTQDPHPQVIKHTVQDIYVGIDVWGRGSHGGGGFGSYRALDHIAPQTLGLSCALFAQGWTWETEENNPGWNWDSFWNYDSSLWVGPASGTVTVPPLQIKGGETPCTHGPFTPLATYFPHLPPPEPYDLPFYTNFSPGIGDSWFVEGLKVWQSVRGWTDMDKQTLVGDLVWPRPKVTRLDSRTDAVPIGITKLNMADAWNGGNSIRITLTIPGSSNAYSALWVPIQTLNLTSRRKYEATAVYKAPTLANAETEFALGLRTAAGTDLMTIVTSSTIDLANGWQKAVVQFEITTPAAGGQVLTQGQLGLIVAVVLKNPSPAVELPFLVGQLAVYPYVPDSYTEYDLVQHWIYFEPDSASTPLNGMLNFEVAVAFDPVPEITITDPEDPRVPWHLQPTKPWFPKFLYFNVYAQQLPGGAGSTPGPLTWIGTTTYINVGDKKTFYVLQDNLPYSSGQRRYDFKVQPVLETGEVYPAWVSFSSVSVLGGASVEELEEGEPQAESSAASSAETESVQEPLAQADMEKKPKRKSSVTSMLNPLNRLKVKGDKADKGDGASTK
ncbi:hypothetical protein D9611_002993 [Ephemerocybe angulata]|uniref:Cytosolic endo-beta-N-acetylglucosaminidase TIM barrel domain-containing protein n=1 Tax=Ephemerocybe angulata TaxID=980116 RepID=A0A8H5CA90_9AGAR|nr:hypothetical protein D9611_002993 [Tulosesus angulatus]